MSGTDLALFAAALAGYALVSGRLAGSPLSGPLLFTLLGLLVGVEGLDLLDVGADVEGIKLLAEVTLALVLFSDSSRLDVGRLRREWRLPARLLGIGLPLSILVGAALGAVMFPQLLVSEALVLAVLLAPTDAALGQSVVSDPRLPSDVRQGLNVESGLNDGICVPLLIAAIALADVERSPSRRGAVLVDLVEELAVAVAVGLVVAGIVAWAFRIADRRGWVGGPWVRIVPLTVVAIAYPVTVELGGSGFIACFVAGLVFGALIGDRSEEATELIEEAGDVLSGATFFVVAAVLLGPVLTRLDLTMVVYAVASLTVVRMVPVALSLLRTSADPATMLFIGWFGPRGLATIVFALIVVQGGELEGARLIVDIAVLTVAMSIVAHGLSAPGLTERFVRRGSPDAPPTADSSVRQ